jgi:tRNA-specific 2-thiouridylase
MSGGVDSLMTAGLLKERGYDVFGVHMHILPPSRDCPEETEDFLRAREALVRAQADILGLPVAFFDFRSDFERIVVHPFLKAYQSGLTPNPCVVCNPGVKFGRLLDEVRRLGADCLATGHYAVVAPPEGERGRCRLYRGADDRKDQSYFLYGLTQEHLASAMFPLGSTTKKDVAAWAETKGFARLVPEESQEICFITSGRYSEFLKERLCLPVCSTRGPIVDMQGRMLGMHEGVFSYTVGQRRGLGVASTEPYYVVALDPASNTVRVGRESDLYCGEALVEDVNWVSIERPGAAIHCAVRIRNQHRPAPAWVHPRGAARAIVLFDEPQRAVTPGQAAVFYDGPMLLGGGTIAANAGGLSVASRSGADE